MKYFRIIATILFLLSISSVAHTQNLAVEIIPVTDTESDWEFQISFIFNTVPDNGVEISLPEGISVRPVSLSLNDESLWLLKSSEMPQLNSIVHWEMVNDNLQLFFGENFVTVGSNVNIICIATIQNSVNPDEPVYVRNIVSQGEDFLVVPEAIISGNIPVIPNR